jgi:DNA-binding MarR family transcriptional regulator
MTAGHIEQVRRFNRIVTQRVGALDDHFLGRDRPLGESRVLFEIGPQGADLRDLRARLGLDSGYLSRLVQSLAAKRLVKLSAGKDERVRRAQLTKAGLAEFAEMNRRSDQKAQTILAPLTAPQRERLVAAMSEVQRLLRAAGIRIERTDPASEAARWCVAQYFAELERRFEAGFKPDQSLPLEDAELIPPRGAFLVAGLDGEWVGCGAVKHIRITCVLSKAPISNPRRSRSMASIRFIHCAPRFRRKTRSDAFSRKSAA